MDQHKQTIRAKQNAHLALAALGVHPALLLHRLRLARQVQVHHLVLALDLLQALLGDINLLGRVGHHQSAHALARAACRRAGGSGATGLDHTGIRRDSVLRCRDSAPKYAELACRAAKLRLGCRAVTSTSLPARCATIHCPKTPPLPHILQVRAAGRLTWGAGPSRRHR